MSILPDEIKPACQGAMPATVVTCSRDGTPNTTVVSQVFYVDGDHVALSFQFFNKTAKNVRENPRAVVEAICPVTYAVWQLDLDFDHSETEGAVFDAMDMQIEAIASMTGMSGIFKLRAADVYRVTAVRKKSFFG